MCHVHKPPTPQSPHIKQVLVSHVMELSRMSSYFVAAFRWLLTDDLTEAQRAQRVLGCNHLERPGVRAYACVVVGGSFDVSWSSSVGVWALAHVSVNP